MRRALLAVRLGVALGARPSLSLDPSNRHARLEAWMTGRAAQRRRLDAQRRRREMAAAATPLFAAAGFGATSVADVADALGISRSAIYERVGGKQALFELCVDVAAADASAAVDAARRGPDDATALATARGALAAFRAASPDQARLLSHAPAALEQILGPALAGPGAADALAALLGDAPD